MATTATKTRTIRDALNTAKEGEMDDALAKVQLGNHLAPWKVTFAALTSAAAQNITTAAALAAATMGSLSPAAARADDFTQLPPILSVTYLRVTAGAALAGTRIVGDAGATALAGDAAGPGVALLSDDGATLTFEAAVTGFVLGYIPRACKSTGVGVDIVGTLFSPS
jgi:hypothetical protein